MNRVTSLMALALTMPSILHAETGAWTSSGPIADGINIGSSAFALETTAPTTAYAAGYPGVWKTTNGGVSWVSASTGITNSTVESIAIDPTNSNVVYAGSYGVFKSTDAGTNWSDISDSFGYYKHFVSALAIDPVNPTTVYAGLGGGIGVWKTTDGGSNWLNINHWGDSNGLVPATIKALAIDPSAHLTIYAATELNGLWKSTDGGTNWATAGLASEGVYAIVIDPANNSIIYAAGQPSLRATDGTYGVFKSLDGGASWAPINNGLPSTNGTPTVDGRGLSIDSSTGTVYLATYGSGVYRSTDAGASWTAFNDGIPEEDPVSPTGARNLSAIAAVNGVIYTGSNSAIYTYSASNAGQTAFSISGSSSGSNYSLSLTAQLNVTSSDVGQTGNIYIAALLPDSLGGGWYLNNGIYWVPWTGGALPVYSSGPLTNTSVSVLNGMDVSSLTGTSILVGYGRDENDMLTNQKYSVIHTIH